MGKIFPVKGIYLCHLYEIRSYSWPIGEPFLPVFFKSIGLVPLFECNCLQQVYIINHIDPLIYR